MMGTTGLKKGVFMRMVMSHLYEHPDWMEDIIHAASEGVLAKVKDNRKTSVDVQISLSMLYSNQYSKLSKLNKKKVLRAILECDAYQGTPFADGVKQRLDKLENK